MKNIRNEEAVSPVIAVVLLVVITVILAAIIAVFAFGIGSPEKTPQAKLKFTALNTSATAGNDTLTIRHNGGDPLKLENLQLYIDTKLYGVNMTVAGCTPTNGLAINGVLTCLPVGWSVNTSDVVKVTILHVPSGQNIADTEVGVN